MDNIGLVLEGGGMRGVYTSGILEFFLESNIHLPYVIGVSAGACVGVSYVSKQRGRNRAITIDYAGSPQYMSYRRLLLKRELFNMDFLFDEIPNMHNPFDYDTFFNSKQKFYIGTTDCHTGESIYYEKSDLKQDLNKILRASSSLPFVADIVEHEGKHLLDGGLSDPIPIRKSLSDGNAKNIIILTQPFGYVKKSLKRGKWAFKRKYGEYKGLLNIMIKRANKYNETLDFIQRLEQEGKAIVFRPENLMGVSRTEQKTEKLEALYEHGYNQAKSRKDEILHFIEEKISSTVS